MDRRIKYTKQVIKETFISLLNEKDIKKISVSEICKIADINRATFYRYYLDIYDLLDKIKEEFVIELKNASENSNDTNSVYAFSKELISVLYNNKELTKIIFKNNTSMNFLDEILEVAYNKCREKWLSDIPNLNEENIEYAAVFLFNGALGVINFWVKEDFDNSIDEIAEIIESLSYYGTIKYIYNKH